MPRYARNRIVVGIPELMDLIGLEPRIRCFGNPLMETGILRIQAVRQLKISMIRITTRQQQTLVSLTLLV